MPRRSRAEARVVDVSMDATLAVRTLPHRSRVAARVADASAGAISAARISRRHYRAVARVPRVVPRLVGASAVRRLPLPKMAVDRVPMLLRPTIARVEAMYAETAAGKAVTGREGRVHAILDLRH